MIYKSLIDLAILEAPLLDYLMREQGEELMRIDSLLIPTRI
jgi:hypothetical protein